MQPFVMVIFGATGDLMKTKLLPALLNLYKEKKLGENFSIVGFARRPFANEEFRNLMGADESFGKHLYYQQGDFTDINAYHKLLATFKKIDFLYP